MYRQSLEQVKGRYNMRLGAKENILANIQKAEIENVKHTEAALLCAKTLELLNQVSVEAREKAKTHLEEIVTEALQFISGEDYEFKIEMLDRGKPSCDFFVESTINGVRSRQRPESAVGGGFVDIIATALRYAYLEIFSDPTIQNGVLFLDEPGKMVSELASIKFGQFIKFLGNNFDRQTIMITHNENLMGIAEKAFQVGQVDGISQLTCVDAGTTEDVILEEEDSVFDLENLNLEDIEL